MYVFTPIITVSRFIGMKNHLSDFITHAENSLSKKQRIVVTGGGSRNLAIQQIAADVFGSGVFVQDATHDSASLGGALRATTVLCNTVPSLPLRQVAEPRIQLPKFVFAKYRELEADFLKNN